MTNHTDHYKPQLKAWQGKLLGQKPGNDLLAVAHQFGRPGKQSLALAMALRPEGVTGSQVNIACGAPQNNHRVKLIRAKYFARVATPANELNHTVYKIELTAKGKAKVDKPVADPPQGAATPAKPKAVKKPKAKKAPKVEVPEVVPAAMIPTEAELGPLDSAGQ